MIYLFRLAMFVSNGKLFFLSFLFHVPGVQIRQVSDLIRFGGDFAVQIDVVNCAAAGAWSFELDDDGPLRAAFDLSFARDDGNALVQPRPVEENGRVGLIADKDESSDRRVEGNFAEPQPVDVHATQRRAAIDVSSVRQEARARFQIGRFFWRIPRIDTASFDAKFLCQPAPEIQIQRHFQWIQNYIVQGIRLARALKKN
jgi:hypothetical protein